MSIHEITVEHGLTLVDQPDLDNDPEYYGSIASGNLFFSRRLKADDWEISSLSDRRKALYQAADIINKLNFIGEKTTATQKMEFPRGGDTETPDNITNAAYLIAIKLLSGSYNPDLELQSLVVTRDRFGTQVEVEQEATPFAHAIAGVPSIEAWRLLAPYLIDTQQLDLIRA
jgi:hypothetical protein